MSPAQLKKIEHFTAKEIVSTGAAVADVSFLLFCALDRARARLRRRMVLLKNGLTTGDHKAPEHENGTACDFALNEKDGAIDTVAVVRELLDSGFRGIGIYFNGTALSFHADMREKYSFWRAVKNPDGAGWKYFSWDLDPRTIKLI